MTKIATHEQAVEAGFEMIAQDSKSGIYQSPFDSAHKIKVNYKPVEFTVEHRAGTADVFADGVKVGDVYRRPERQASGRWQTWWAVIGEGVSNERNFATKSDAISAVKEANA